MILELICGLYILLKGDEAMIEDLKMNDLNVSGALSMAVLTKIANTKNGMSVSTGSDKSCLSFKTENGKDIRSFRLEDCEKKSAGERAGTFYHHNSGMEIRIEWRNIAGDALACNVAFSMGNNDTVLREIEFSLPGYLQVSGKNQDILVYPDAGGVKIENPAGEFFKPVKYETGDWKDRKMWVREEGFQNPSNGGKTYTFFEGKSPSMMWLDYYGENGGVYFASHDPGIEKTSFAVTVSENKKGLNLSMRKTFNRFLKEWNGDFVIGVHEGDWHRGADIYRTFYRVNCPPARKAPEFIRESPGMVCHYDFKWQNGDINHHFNDIPLIYEDALKHGFKNIMIAGWNIGGFDSMYPNFRPDPALGTEEELVKAVSDVKKKGGKVFFYINAYSYDKASPDYEKFGEKWAVRDIDGNTMDVKWGKNILSGMCNSAAGWREKVKNNVKYIIDTLGAGGVYIDQLSVVPKECYCKEHNHTAGWVLNNCSMLREIREELGRNYDGKIFLFSEHLNDVLTSQLDSQLIQTFWMTGIKYAFPEMFRYTFPDALLTDMVLPKPWPLNPSAAEERHVRNIVSRQFLMNILFWTYDHVLENPRIGKFFNSVVSLKNRYKSLLTEAEFRDDVLIRETLPDVNVKSYIHPSGKIIFTVWNRTGKEGSFTLKEKYSGVVSACDLEEIEKRDIIESGVDIPFSGSLLSAIVLETASLSDKK